MPSSSRADYASIDSDFQVDPGLLQAVRWPRVPGLFASMNSPSVRPQTLQEWWLFFTTTRAMPITHNFWSNLKAGATVACVNIPLSVSLALASGGTPTQGMICALWSSVIVGLFGGSHFNVVGTTSALSGMQNKLVMRYGDAVLPTVAVYAACFLLVFWLLRLDRAMRYVATPVAHGFAVGVAIMIAFGQLSSSFGMRGLPPADGFVNKLEQFMGNIELAHPSDAVLYVSSASLLFFLAFRWGRVPWVLFIAALGIAIGMVTTYGRAAGAPGAVYLLREKFPEIAMSLRAPNVVLPTWVPFVGYNGAAVHCERHQRFCLKEGPNAWQYQPDVLFYSFGCAVVALLETLISAQIANRLLKNVSEDFDLLSRTYSSSRESLALAFTAGVCGLMGSICPAAALARTSLNVKSGAWSRVSGLVSAVLLGVVAFAVMPYFEFLPFAFVGSILLLVSYRLVDFEELRTIRNGDPAGMYLCILTAVVCLFLDTFMGLIIGTVASIAMNWHVFKTLPITVEASAHKFVRDGLHTLVGIRSSVTFANVSEADEVLEQVLISAIEAEERYFSVHLDLKECVEMDFDAMETLDEWSRKMQLAGAKLTIDRGIHLTRILGVAHNLKVSEEKKSVVPTPNAATARRGSGARNSL